MVVIIEDGKRNLRYVKQFRYETHFYPIIGDSADPTSKKFKKRTSLKKLQTKLLIG